MRQPPTYTWKITGHSPEDAQALQHWLSSRINLDRVLTDTVRATPNGVEQVQIVQHRLDDYFADIRMLPDSQANPTSFRLVFHRRPDSARFWKDLMVNILQEIETAPQKASIELDSKGEMDTGISQKGKTQMADSEQELQELLANRPRESLGLELKQWIDPSTPEGKGKIVKSCIAFRNNDGGRLVIGFKNDGTPDLENSPPDVLARFHGDVVQGIVSKYSSEVFPVEVAFIEVGGQDYPVITVPPGVRTPVAAKADLKGVEGNCSFVTIRYTFARSNRTTLSVRPEPVMGTGKVLPVSALTTAKRTSAVSSVGISPHSILSPWRRWSLLLLGCFIGHPTASELLRN
jgi:hypothetical protein